MRIRTVTFIILGSLTTNGCFANPNKQENTPEVEESGTQAEVRRAIALPQDPLEVEIQQLPSSQEAKADIERRQREEWLRRQQKEEKRKRAIQNDQMIPETLLFNDLNLRSAQTFPKEGGYSTKREALQRLEESIILQENQWLGIQPKLAKPSFCSGATYLAFLTGVSYLQYTGKIGLSSEALQALEEVGQPDGTGIWGRWNANGPGTAKLVAELGCGVNFTEIEAALPGDFLKIWWTEEIGKKEKGHSGIYLGKKTQKEIQYVGFWSSNIPEGYSEKWVPETECKKMLFTRITHPEKIEGARALPKQNEFLQAMLKKSFTWEEIVEECNVKKRP